MTKGLIALGNVYCVISHTHWDREWYLSFEKFRIRLVDMIDNLLEIMARNECFRFHLDAQTVLFEDYMEIRPESRGKLEQYISEGRIMVGPWYIQSDFFLTSGEATIRNLLIGSTIAETFGKCMPVGYTPDQFGLISQLPQILKKFDIDTFLFARGYSFDSPVTSEFYWQSEDGSRVFAVYMPFWYNNAQRFSTDIIRSLKMVGSIREGLEPVTSTGYYLLMNGVDHLEAQEDLLEILDEINKRLPEGDKIIQDTMPEYMDKVMLSASQADIFTYTGEMRNGGKRNILAGTLSSRVYLKQTNVKCQNLLEKLLEPLYTFIEMLGIGNYPHGFFRYMWKLLLKNHAHDSICGCSLDQVHEHMMDRFRSFDEVGQELVKKGMELISSYISRKSLKDGHYLITVINTLICILSQAVGQMRDVM